MRNHITKLMATLGVLAIGATVPAIAQARHGGDDPVGHQRHGAHERVHHHKRHHKHHHVRHHHRHGADDGPNHS